MMHGQQNVKLLQTIN